MTELRATYRLQLGPGLDFRAVRELVPYLRDLGISHLYLSPSFQAREGSTHGYDVVDPGSISRELGGEDAFRELAGAGLGIVLDIVPNHMAADESNRYWADEELRRKFFDVDPVSGRHRRFFDIDHLAGVRQEDPEVFDETHRLALQLVREGLVDGLRIDHPDGLADPAGYLRRLHDAGVERIWVEKILDPGEPLRDWPVEGTVGYEFLNDLAALFVDPAGEDELTRLYQELTGERRGFGEVAFEAKLQQACTTFAPEVERLRRIHDMPDTERALASLPVYRTYDGGSSDEDRRVLAEAGLPGLYDDRPAEWITCFQQTTPPVMAKGVEDTAFYRWNRLLALNDVGGDPSRFSIPVEHFHAANRERARRFPRGLLITQTHDTKRSGDVRARIGALAGMAAEWRERVTRWCELNAALREGDAPDRNEEYLIYQTLAGAWPLEPQRLEAYVEKALREEKVHTSWVDQDEAWESAVKRFCGRLYDNRPFVADLEAFVDQRLAPAGERAALGQLLLKLTSPGVPDVYQGDELWALSLVDPDNRRPVDWERRRRALEGLRGGEPPSRETAKLFLIQRTLALRAARPDAFAGGYEPVEAGEAACAFIRGGEVLAACGVRPGWEDAELHLPPAAEGVWRDVLAGGDRRLSRRARLGEVAFNDRALVLLAR